MEENKIKLRRTCDELYMSGSAAMAFGFWSIIKFTMYIMVFSDRIKEMLNIPEIEQEPYGNYVLPIFYGLIYLALLLDLALRIYVGRSARAEGRGKKKSLLYVVLAGIIWLVNVVSVVSSIAMPESEYTTKFEMVISVIVDLTTVFCFSDLIISAVTSRKLRKLIQEGE